MAPAWPPGPCAAQARGPCSAIATDTNWRALTADWRAKASRTQRRIHYLRFEIETPSPIKENQPMKTLDLALAAAPSVISVTAAPYGSPLNITLPSYVVANPPLPAPRPVPHLNANQKASECEHQTVRAAACRGVADQAIAGGPLLQTA
jgi:hypothetical protein